jgi:thiamine biosynthesis lipoprotein
MSDPSSRRDFLKGKSTIRALRKATNEFSFELSPDVSPELEVRQAAYLEEYSKSAMACQFELLFNLHQYRAASAAAMKAFALIDQLEDQLTVYRDHSEISSLNRIAFTEPTRVEQNLFGLLRRAAEIHQQTSGAFDMTSGELSSIWGFEQGKGSVPAVETIHNAIESVGTQHIEFDANNESVRFLRDGTKINLGGIGKGYAIDRVVALFTEHKIGDFVIHGGQSSVYAKGSQKRIEDETGGLDQAAQRGWPIGLSHPTFPDQRLAEFYLQDAALGTSGTGRQGFFHHGKKYGHIIDPRTGWPTDLHLSTTVIAKSAATADALATAFFVMPLEEIELYCRSHLDVSAVCVGESTNKKNQVEITWFNISDEDWNRL